MEEAEFWLRLANLVSGVLRSSRDNSIRFLWVDGFDTASGNVWVDLERKLVTARAWVYGGRTGIYIATLHLSTSAVEHWREGHWSALLPPADESDWVTISPTERRMEILLGDAPSCNPD